MRNWKKR